VGFFRPQLATAHLPQFPAFQLRKEALTSSHLPLRTTFPSCVCVNLCRAASPISAGRCSSRQPGKAWLEFTTRMEHTNGFRWANFMDLIRTFGPCNGPEG